MAITWGPGEGSNNLFYVGIDVSVGTTSATVKFYVKSQYWSEDNQRLTYGGAVSGYTDFYHSPGKTAQLVKTFTVTGSANQSKTVSATLSGVYNGATPSHSRTFTFPPPAITAPNPPVGFTSTRVSDSTTNHSWSSPATSGKPVDNYRLERYDYANPGAGYVHQATTTSTSHRTTNGVYNNRYRYRLRAGNSAGVSGWVYSSDIYTTPKAPSNVTLKRLSSGALQATWVDWSPHNTDWEIAWAEDGSYGSTATLPDSSNSASKTSPNTLVSHRFRIRAKVGSLVSGWVESNLLSLLAKPNPPSSLTSGVVDPAVSDIRAGWRFNPTDGSTQQAYQIRRKLVGESSFTELPVVNSGSEDVVWPAGTFTSGTGVEWQVRTKGEHADWSEWSASSTYTFAATPVVTILQPDGADWRSPVLTVEWVSSEPQAQYRVVLTDESSGARLDTREGSGSATSVTMNHRAVTGESYRVQVDVRSTAGLWSDPVDVTFLADFPLPALVSTSVVWDAVRGWAVCGFQAEEAVPGVTVTPHEVDLWRSENGVDGPWELVAQSVPLDGTTVTDTEPAVDGSAIWVARARNTELETEADGPVATTQVTHHRGYLSAGPGYETVSALIWDPKTTLTVGRPSREVITLDGGDNPRRVLTQTPEITRQLEFSGRLYSDAPNDQETRDQYEHLVILDGPHLYRDGDGRKIYGGLSTTPVGRGEKAIWWDVSFSIHESDHDAITGEVFPA